MVCSSYEKNLNFFSSWCCKSNFMLQNRFSIKYFEQFVQNTAKSPWQCTYSTPLSVSGGSLLRILQLAIGVAPDQLHNNVYIATSTFQASYFNRIVKLWNYVCKLAPPTSFCSPNAFQLFVRKLVSTHLSRVYELNYPCTWTLVPTCLCHS